MDGHVPRKRGRPKKYFTVEERREATRASAKKSLQKKRERERLAANRLRDPSHSTPTARSERARQTKSCRVEGLQNKITTDPVRFTFQPPPASQDNRHSPSQFVAPLDSLRPRETYDSSNGYARKADVTPDASGYPPWRTGEYLRKPIIAHNTGAISSPGYHIQTMMHFGTLPNLDKATMAASNEPHAMIRPPREEHRAVAPSTSRLSLEKQESSNPPDNHQRVDGLLSISEMVILAAELKRNPKRHQDLLQSTLNMRNAEKEAHAACRVHGNSDEHSHQLETKGLDIVHKIDILAKKIKLKPERYRRILEDILQRNPDQYRDLLHDVRARQAQREAETQEKVRALMEQRVTHAQWAFGSAETAREYVVKQAEARKPEERARQVKAHEDTKNAKRERLLNAAHGEVRHSRALEQVQNLSKRPQDDFDRHVCYISDWLQAASYGQQHTFPTDGQAIYIKKIKPRIQQIERSAMSNSASFAIQFVALMALTHIIRLLYVHRVRKIGAEVLRYYEADAKLDDTDQLTSAMLEIIEERVHHVDKAWLKTHQGAAGVLMREILEVWSMVCSYGRPVQVQQNLGGILWRGFGYRPVPSFR